MTNEVDLHQIEREFEQLPGAAGLALLVLDARGRELHRLEKTRDRELFPLGSVFKLYVLAELARQVAEGRVDPSAAVEIREDRKSLPTGEMQALLAGTAVEIREMAAQMIAISDNTATDHLIDLVGRESIERHLAEYENSAPARNTPFLYSREMFLMKGAGARRLRGVFGVSSMAEISRLWVEADTKTRRAWLASLSDQVADFSFMAFQEFVARGYRVSTFHPEHAEIEWVARPSDIVSLLRAAHEGRLVSEAASSFFLEIFAEGPILCEHVRVREHGFKGGRERGVSAYALRLVLDSGHTILACLCLADLSVPEMREIDAAAESLQRWFGHMIEALEE